MLDALSVPFFFVLGLALLIKGGDFLVDGSKALALRLGLTPMVVGLTVVGFGTSAPELLVSVQAALHGSPAIALGNVMGSNVANVLLILAVGGVLAKGLALPFASMQRDLLFMMGSAALAWFLLSNGTVGRMDGLLLLAGLALFLFLSLRGDHGPALSEDAKAALPKAIVSIALVVGGLVALVFGARFLVDAATTIARGVGISEAVIGLTVVAVGTSLPELSATIAAARKGEMAIAVGNVVGSNIFNILGILGATALIAPIPADGRFVLVDAPLALGVAVLVTALAGVYHRLSLRAAWALLGLYVAYTLTMLVG